LDITHIFEASSSTRSVRRVRDLRRRGL